MRTVTYTCDCCMKQIVLTEDAWIMRKDSGDSPLIQVRPWRKSDLKGAKGHACSKACVAKILQAFLETTVLVPLKKESTAAASEVNSILSSMWFIPPTRNDDEDDD